MSRAKLLTPALSKALFVPIAGLVILGLLIVLWKVQQSNVDSLYKQIQKLQQEIQRLPASIAEKDRIALQKDILIIEKDRINSQNGIYGTLVQAIGGVFFFITAYFTWRNVKATKELALSKLTLLRLSPLKLTLVMLTCTRPISVKLSAIMLTSVWLN